MFRGVFQLNVYYWGRSKLWCVVDWIILQDYSVVTETYVCIYTSLLVECMAELLYGIASDFTGVPNIVAIECISKVYFCDKIIKMCICNYPQRVPILYYYCCTIKQIINPFHKFQIAIS